MLRAQSICHKYNLKVHKRTGGHPNLQVGPGAHAFVPVRAPVNRAGRGAGAGRGLLQARGRGAYRGGRGHGAAVPVAEAREIAEV